MTNIELNMYVGQWRRLHTARGDIPPLLQMAGNGGGGTVSTNKKLTKLY